MSTAQNAANIAILQQFVNDVNSGKKTPAQLEIATAFNGASDVALVIQGGKVKRINPSLFPSASGGTVDAVVGSTDVSVNATDPANPIVSLSATKNLEISGAVTTGNNLKTNRTIQGFFVPALPYGRTTWAVNDVFMGAVGSDRFVVGIVVDDTVNLPADIDGNKVSLFADNSL